MVRKTVWESVAEEQDRQLQQFCDSLSWDKEKLWLALTDNSVPNIDFYLETPYNSIITKLAKFILQSDKSLFAVYAPHGHGKTSLSEYAIQTIQRTSKKYFFIRIANPGLYTHQQIARDILRGIGIDKVPRNMDDIKAILYPELIEARKRGMIVVIWIDESQQLKPQMIDLIRQLSDLRVDGGDKVCKIIITGTMRTVDRIDEYEKKYQDQTTDIQAFRERLSVNIDELKPWNIQDIQEYWSLLSHGLGGTKSPFSKDAAKTVLQITDGVPRSVVQLTEYSISHAAFKGTGLPINSECIHSALKEMITHG